jgi:molecular chaperone GrpE
MTEPLTNEEDTDVDDEGREAEASADAERDEGSSEAEAASEVRDARDDVEASRRSDGRTASATGDEGDTELVALREEFDRLNDRHLRLVAEFNNFRRRSEQERLSAWSRAQADLVGRFLDVLDDLQRVAHLDLTNATVETIMEGIDLVERKFVRMLGDAGVEMIDPTGEPFDPELMEAMMRVPAEDDEQIDTVAQVFQKGYSLKGILVRPARVSVYTQG